MRLIRARLAQSGRETAGHLQALEALCSADAPTRRVTRRGGSRAIEESRALVEVLLRHGANRSLV